MTSIKQQWSIPELQGSLDMQTQSRFETYNNRTAKVAELVNNLQKVSLDLLRREGDTGFDAIDVKYQNLLNSAKQLLPSSVENITPITLDINNPKESAEKIQNQIEYLQLLSNNEQAKETNLLDLSLKNYFAISQTLSEIAKTLFGFIKHVLGNSTGR